MSDGYKAMDPKPGGSSAIKKFVLVAVILIIAAIVAVVVVVETQDDSSSSNSAGQRYTSLSQAQVDDMTAQINALINTDPNNIPRLVRLSFHDCIGGCNGCLNLLSGGGNDPGNNGLSGIMQSLENIYQAQNYSKIISRADFWALGGHVGVIAGANQNAPVILPNITFLWGRKECATSPYENTRLVGLPDATRNITEVKRVFVDGLGLTLRQATALIGGGHSLGQCHSNNSGFAGPWKQPSTVFNNGFFIELNSTTRNWTQVQQTDSLFYQWNNSNTPKIMMLNTDMSFLKDFTPEDSNGKVTACTYSSCPASEAAQWVSDYAADNGLLMEDFAVAWDIMLSQGPTSTTGPGSEFINLYAVGENATTS